MVAQRSVKTGTCTSRVSVSYLAKFVDNGQLELTVDCASDPGMLQLRVCDPNGAVVCDRVVRKMPQKATFNATAAGRYEMELSTVGPRVRRAFSWSDWDKEHGHLEDPGLPAGIIAYGFLDVE